MKSLLKVLVFAFMTQVMLLTMYWFGTMKLDGVTLGVLSVLGTTCITGTYFGALMDVK